MSERIEGQVAQILNARELVLNRGTEHGVRLGMRFAILNQNGRDITDPETGASLGSVEVEKTVVKVVRVEERMCVARTFRTIAGTASIADIIMRTSPLGGTPSRTETLKTEETTYEQELDEADSFIKRGDVAVQVVGEEFAE